MEKAERWLQDTLQFRFRDAGLLGRALTHRSAAGRSNERLEFLGDAVLDFVISEAVFKLRPDAEEGDLSRLRASLVKDTALAEIAVELGIGEHLVLGSGEKKSGGHRRESILADAVEAVFGAVFLDSGVDAARDMILRVFAHRLETLPDAEDLRDPKTRLQEWLQARKLALPVYELTEVHGKDHRRRFSVTCTVTELSQSTGGESTSRRKAEQQAARDMLAILSGERP
ncbi:MAG: ribonuclease III [Gammaproteobacteria bacterium]|nr:ribonuclease III [Gammaproteobacteria bacterium]NNF48893.1 ribonuclease III [Woeseiaceae bacterium]MBT8095016.1 ribonuclease III [Gammaproteobacteria bacterium]MBT8104686.1 ribonuclease III [Gammaproteobacteria bacterium]NNK24700.1 ribonuclease III [Woeseiaceae bacterium]